MNISRKHKKQIYYLENFSLRFNPILMNKSNQGHFCRSTRRKLKYDMKCVRIYERNQAKLVLSSVYGKCVTERLYERNQAKQDLSSVYGTCGTER